MKRKITSVLTLVAFLVFTMSCVYHRIEKIDARAASYSEKKNMKIVGVQTIEQKYFDFSEDDPATFSGVTIEGKTIKNTELEINRSEIENLLKSRRGKSTEIKTKDGKTYEVHSYRETEDKIIVTKMYEWISIPFSQVELVWVRETKAGAGQYILGGVVLGALVFAIIAAVPSISGPPRKTSTTECCPFVYSFDGDTYMFDAEPYGGAICQGLERTEWCPLENLQETDGQYKILITNELNETQYTNEVALLVVDHPKDTDVVPDISGKVHTIYQPVVPDKAFDSKGNDLMPFFIKNDRVFWTTRIKGRDPDKKEDLRDELILEFPKPQDANTAKLLVNACTTIWGSQVVKQYLDLYGDTVHDWYNNVKDPGPTYYQFVNMHLKDELYALNIRVQTKKGWMSKGLIRGGGPLISEDRVYTLDLTDVPGDVLKIKLTPPANFWMINHLAVDYSDDLAVNVKEIKPARAFDNNGRDIRKAIVSDDSDYHVMPSIGDQAELIFEALPQVQGMQRSLILKIKGYYDIHLDAKGKPQLAMIDRLQKEPGFVVQHAFKEYLKWKDEVMKKYFSQ